MLPSGKKLEHLAFAPTPVVRSETVEALKRLVEIELTRESEAKKLRETMQEVVKGLAVMRGQLKLQSRLLSQLVRISDTRLITDQVVAAFGEGPVEAMRVDLGTSTDVVLRYKNDLARPVRMRIWVATAGANAVDIKPKATSAYGVRLTLTTAGAATDWILLMPGQEVYTAPTADPTSATIVIEIADWAAWTEPGGGRPGTPV